jgi:hypothetical protein
MVHISFVFQHCPIRSLVAAPGSETHVPFSHAYFQRKLSVSAFTLESACMREADCVCRNWFIGCFVADVTASHFLIADSLMYSDITLVNDRKDSIFKQMKVP